MILRALLLVLFSVPACLGYGQPAPPPAVDVPQSQAEGRALAQEIVAQRPETNSAQTGVLKIRAGDKRFELHIRFSASVTPTNWEAVYFAATVDKCVQEMRVTHTPDQPNRYLFGRTTSPAMSALPLSGISIEQVATLAFADSDFSFADLGLEFFHWPEQRIIKKEMRRSRTCKVLESKNPNPSTNSYSRVVSWIDSESHGIIRAEAYDAGGRLLKVFEPKDFKKVNGQWQLQSMEIRNVQTGSRTRIEFAPAGK